MTGQLCLKWNNHASAFNKLLSKIFLEDMYSDGTILCQGKFYPVHRFVLSTCSEYFEEMFRQCVRLNNKHPFIIVKDIHPEQMEALLNYMYKGEVNVPQEMLPELIKAAEAFKIKGLAVPDEEPSKTSRKRSIPSSPSAVSKKSRKHDERISTSSKRDSNSASDTAIEPKKEEIFLNDIVFPEIKAEPVDIIETNTDNSGQVPAMNDVHNYSTKSYSEEEDSNFESFDFDPGDENFDDTQSGPWDSSQMMEGEEANNDDHNQRVDGIFVSKNLFIHGDSSNSNNSLPSTPSQKQQSTIVCSFSGCNFKTIRPSAMKIHYRKHTGEKPYKCPQCDYRSTQKNNVTTHFNMRHNINRS